MSKVMIGSGNATGMAFRAPKGTALPATPGASLGADWESVGAITEDGISLTLPSGDVLRNWALQPERKVNTEPGSVSAPFMYTDEKVLGALFGDANVTEVAASSQHGNVASVTLSPDVAAEPCAWLFLMKDGDKLAMLGTTNGLITDISDVSFAATEGVTWTASIQGDWTYAVDDGEVTS